jgi:hypothetical protein
MATLNDHKRNSLLSILNVDSGHIDDLETAWLLVVVIAPNGIHINDLWKQKWKEDGVTLGQYNHMFYTWLGNMGYTGTLNDRQHQYWEFLDPGDFPNFAILGRAGSAILDYIDRFILSRI